MQNQRPKNPCDEVLQIARVRDSLSYKETWRPLFVCGFGYGVTTYYFDGMYFSRNERFIFELIYVIYLKTEEVYTRGRLVAVYSRV
jgi:hypothetical protein